MRRLFVFVFVTAFVALMINACCEFGSSKRCVNNTETIVDTVYVEHECPNDKCKLIKRLRAEIDSLEVELDDCRGE